jgi:lipopolysaccharide export system permease protein
MKAAGISAHQILAPLILASIGIAALSFAFNETVVVNAARKVTAWTDNDYKPVPIESGVLSNVWVRDGNDLVRARFVGGSGPRFHAEGVTIFDRSQGSALSRIIDADRAFPVDGAWRLENVRIYDSAAGTVTRKPQMIALDGVEPTRLTLAKIDPDQMDFFILRDRIDELDRAGRPTAAARAGLWHKISGPVSTLLMPLLAAIAAFGLARSGQVLLRATVGMALGFTYFIADNFSLAMGNVGAYPPLLAAWAPFFLFLLIGETVLIQSEE